MPQLNTGMIVVNLQQIGPVPHRVVDTEVLRDVLATALEIEADTDYDTLTEILAEWETALAWRSFESEPVDDSWYLRALLLTCLRGLRGEMRPQIYTIRRDD